MEASAGEQPLDASPGGFAEKGEIAKAGEKHGVGEGDAEPVACSEPVGHEKDDPGGKGVGERNGKREE